MSTFTPPLTLKYGMPFDPREYQAAYYAANKEKWKKYRADWKALNPEKRRESDAKYRMVHKEQRKAYNDAYLAAHPGMSVKHQRTYRESHREEIEARRKAAYAADPEKVRQEWIKRRAIRQARKVAATVLPMTKEQLQDRWDYFGGKCWMCGIDADTWDHVKPLAKGGAHILANLRPACGVCNSTKNARWPL